ncbi:MAG: PEP-CTERM sorting domain-containing protein [Alphaproteobacteria bacterium]
MFRIWAANTATAVIFAALVFCASPVSALPSLGVPVAGFGQSAAVGNYNAATGEIGMFIPLSGGFAGTYGVGGVGTSGGTFSPGVGRMDLYLRFDVTEAGMHDLNLIFTDLDLDGVNDPSRFFESVRIYDAGGTQLAHVDEDDDPFVTFAEADDQQIIRIPVIANDPFFVRLRLRADTRNFSGQVSNTQEALFASLVFTGVPEPGLLGLMMIGTGALVLHRRRRTRS